jgi:hypothetical protein
VKTTLILSRFASSFTSTPGLLVVEQGSSRWWCYTMEDPVRPRGQKIAGRTAIPSGLYRVLITYSPRFKVDLPLLVGDEQFQRDWSGVRIHSGNKAEDTEGCPLVGMTLDRAEWVSSSAVAMGMLMPILRRSTDTTLRIYNDGDRAP